MRQEPLEPLDLLKVDFYRTLARYLSDQEGLLPTCRRITELAEQLASVSPSYHMGIAELLVCRVYLAARVGDFSNARDWLPAKTNPFYEGHILELSGLAHIE